MTTSDETTTTPAQTPGKPAATGGSAAPAQASATPSPAKPAAARSDPAESDEDGKSVFVVTPRAGPKVAGQRVKDQEHIRLTEDEAASELLTGAIVRKGERLHPQLLADAKPRKVEPVGDASKVS